MNYLPHYFTDERGENSRENIVQKVAVRVQAQRTPPLLEGQRALTGGETSAVSLLRGTFLMRHDRSTIVPQPGCSH